MTQLAGDILKFQEDDFNDPLVEDTTVGFPGNYADIKAAEQGVENASHGLKKAEAKHRQAKMAEGQRVNFNLQMLLRRVHLLSI